MESKEWDERRAATEPADWREEAAKVLDFNERAAAEFGPLIPPVQVR